MDPSIGIVLEKVVKVLVEIVDKGEDEKGLKE